MGKRDDRGESPSDQAERIGGTASAERATTQAGIDELLAEAQRVADSSDQLEETIVRTLRNENKVLKVLLGIALVFGLISSSAGALLSWRSVYKTGPAIEKTEENSQETNKILTQTIESKDSQIADLNGQMSDAKIVIDQAVIYITNMAKEIVRLGGEPPEVVLNPDAPLPEAAP